MKLSKKIITVFCVLAMSVSLSVPAFATESSSLASAGFWDVLLAHAISDFDGVPLVSGLLSEIGSLVSEDICAVSDDGLHHGDAVRLGSGGGRGSYTAVCVCDYCGKEFNATITSDDLQSAYDSYVDTLPATGYTSSGNLIWQPTLSDCKSFSLYDLRCSDLQSAALSDLPFTLGSTSTGSSGRSYCSFDVFDSHSLSVVSAGSLTYWNVTRTRVNFFFCFPFSGSYCLKISPSGSASGLLEDGTFWSADICYYSSDLTFSHYTAGGSGSVSAYTDFGPNGTASSRFLNYQGILYLPVYEVIPDTAVTEYQDTTRPTSITGDYGIIGDDGTITKVDGDYIIDESTSTIYNPVTNTTTNITNWTYDYSDRSYTCTTESGDTVTITYGDENVLAPGGISHSAPGENRQFWPDKNNQS